MKRFYTAVDLAKADGGWRVLLDGRGILTAGKQPQVIPSRALAQAMAAEWEDQGAEIDPAHFFFRDMADYAIDMIAADPAIAIAAILPYGETDTLCYRDAPGTALHRRQSALWEPLLIAAETRHAIRFERISGILHRPQPAETLARLARVIGQQDAFTLAALQTLANLAASLVIGLAALAPDAEIEALWNAANLEEDWQAEMWGKDDEALILRARRLEAFTGAMTFLRLARSA